MSDKFNPLHYLDKRLLEENPSERFQYNIHAHIQKRRKEFKDFSFLVTSEYGIMHNGVDTVLNVKNKQAHYKLHHAYKKVFWLRINNSGNISHDHLYLPKGSVVIHEDISLNKAIKKTNIYSEGDDNYYYLNFHPQSQLFLNEVSFHIKEKLKAYFLNLPNTQRHKNQIDYFLNENAILEHHGLVNIQKGQLQDDSINVTHSKNSHSKIVYQSLNKGKVSSQVNSLVSADSTGCSTEQKIKHIVLDSSAITNSKPNLMIANNDIVASHGNSIGSFNKEDLFYLSQRGLTKDQAYSVLSSSIISDYISKTSIEEQFKKYLKGRIGHE
jgi:Fe-S cluster assembly scaffold protein SufB